MNTEKPAVDERVMSVLGVSSVAIWVNVAVCESGWRRLYKPKGKITTAPGVPTDESLCVFKTSSSFISFQHLKQKPLPVSARGAEVSLVRRVSSGVLHVSKHKTS